MSSSLTHSPADVVRWMLIAQNLGTDPGAAGSWPIHATSEPDSPDNMMTVYDTEGTPDGRVHRTGEVAEHSGIILQVRGVSHPVAWAKAEVVRDFLDESVNKTIVTIEASMYIVYAVTRHSGPLSLGREANTNRFLFTTNAVVALRQIS